VHEIREALVHQAIEQLHRQEGGVRDGVGQVATDRLATPTVVPGERSVRLTTH
jgi:hypothetical protein